MKKKGKKIEVSIFGLITTINSSQILPYRRYQFRRASNCLGRGKHPCYDVHSSEVDDLSRWWRNPVAASLGCHEEEAQLEVVPTCLQCFLFKDTLIYRLSRCFGGQQYRNTETIPDGGSCFNTNGKCKSTPKKWRHGKWPGILFHWPRPQSRNRTPQSKPTPNVFFWKLVLFDAICIHFYVKVAQQEQGKMSVQMDIDDLSEFSTDENCELQLSLWHRLACSSCICFALIARYPKKSVVFICIMNTRYVLITTHLPGSQPATVQQKVCLLFTLRLLYWGFFHKYCTSWQER